MILLQYRDGRSLLMDYKNKSPKEIALESYDFGFANAKAEILKAVEGLENSQIRVQCDYECNCPAYGVLDRVRRAIKEVGE